MQLTCVLGGPVDFPAGMAQNQDRISINIEDFCKCASAEARIDINHATLDELLKIPGLPRSWAGRIVRFRPYRTKADCSRGHLSGEVYDRVKDYVIAHRESSTIRDVSERPRLTRSPHPSQKTRRMGHPLDFKKQFFGSATLRSE